MSTPRTLSERERTLIETTVQAWEAGGRRPLRLSADHEYAVGPDWPDGVGPPLQEELAVLAGAGWLTTRAVVAPGWELEPTAQALAALRDDPDEIGAQRL